MLSMTADARPQLIDRVKIPPVSWELAGEFFADEPRPPCPCCPHGELDLCQPDGDDELADTLIGVCLECGAHCFVIVVDSGSVAFALPRRDELLRAAGIR